MFSFFAPLFLAGATLVGLPWLIHHIRRPEREPIRFSSLMFLPDVKKEVIERRKLQHLLLMCVRMLLLLLMALAFARPYFPERQSYVQESAAPGRHLILVDLSYSMGMSDRFERARGTVDDILDDIPADIPVGLVGFSDSPQLLAPLEGVPGQTRAKVRQALADVAPGQGGTRYQAALQYAENLLLEGRDPEDPAPAVLHLISDFSRQGMPEANVDWRLSGRILFRGYRIDGEPIRNLSLMEIGRKETDNRLTVAGKVKNWSGDQEETATVQLYLDQQLQAEKQVTVAPGGASQVRFDIPRPGAGAKEGRMVLVGDDFELDNLRYFVWRAPHKKTVLLLGDKDNRRWPADWFVGRVLAAADQAPWQVVTSTPDNLTQKLVRRPDVVLAVGVKALSGSDAQALNRYVADGGRVLMTLGGGPTDQVPASLLSQLGLTDNGPAYPRTHEGFFDMLGWVDFNHPAYLVFRGARFNDFSGLRFHNHHRLTLDDAADIRVHARFDGEEDPAIVEVVRGEGRWLFWTFSPVLDWTNLPKHPKFVPLVYETVKYLGRFREEETEYLVGGRYDVKQVEERRLRLPDGKVHDIVADAAGIPLDQAGIVRAGQGERAEEWPALDAVNIPGGESDPETIQIDEFALRLTANGGVAEGAAHSEVERYSGDIEKRNEMGFLFVILLAAFLALELFYAARLSMRKPTDSPFAPQSAEKV